MGDLVWRVRRWLRRVLGDEMPRVIVPAYVAQEAGVPLREMCTKATESDKTPDWRAEMGRMLEGDYVFSDAFSKRFALCASDALIGEGSYGFVLAATDAESGARVAVKFVTRERIPVRDWVPPYSDYPPGDYRGKSVPMEVRVLQMLQGRGATVKLMAHGADNRFAYIVTEVWGASWMPGAGSHDLFACVESRRLPLEGVRSVLQDVVHALLALATHGLVHGDVKDENVLVSADYRARLIDMGSVQVDAPHAQPATAYRGTVLFAPREVVLGCAYVPRHAQQWSLGVLLCVMLHGRPPFSTPEQITDGQLDLPDSPGNDLAVRLLSLSPYDRPSLEAVLSDPFLAE